MDVENIFRDAEIGALKVMDALDGLDYVVSVAAICTVLGIVARDELAGYDARVTVVAFLRSTANGLEAAAASSLSPPAPKLQ